MSPDHYTSNVPAAPAPTTRIVLCNSRSSVYDVVAAHPPGSVAVLSPRSDIRAPRVWWPLIEQCWDARLASVAADYLTRDLPANLRLMTPEASTLLAGALHAASLVNWPIVTLNHLLDCGAVSTVVELLAGADEQELALDVASVAGPTAPDAELVVQAAALAARHLDVARALITGPQPGSPRQLVGGLAGEPTPVICVHDDFSPVAATIIARLRHVVDTSATQDAVIEDVAA